MAFNVIAPLVIVRVDGKDQYVYGDKDSPRELPEGVDKGEVARLVGLGLVVDTNAKK